MSLNVVLNCYVFPPIITIMVNLNNTGLYWKYTVGKSGVLRPAMIGPKGVTVMPP